MSMKSFEELEYRNKTVFVRVDYNVPLDAAGKVTDDKRLRASLPTIQPILAAGGKVVLASHLGRPKKKIVKEFSLSQVVSRLSELLERPVLFAGDCIGEQVERKKLELRSGSVLLLENLRFHAGEEGNDPDFSRQLAANIDVYINEAFSASHRAHASVVGVPGLVPVKGYGATFKKEITYLLHALEKPERPFFAVIGGAKVSDKILMLERLLSKVDGLIIGGAMAFTLLRSQGVPTGDSLVEEDRLDVAAQLLAKAKELGIPVHLPIDHIVRSTAGGEIETTPGQSIPAGTAALDIGPRTLEFFRGLLGTAGTVFWNGPMGKFEEPEFKAGTFGIAETLAGLKACTIAGGGDSASALKKSGFAAKITHVSTGGGASLELIEGGTLPGIQALEN